MLTRGILPCLEDKPVRLLATKRVPQSVQQSSLYSNT